MLLAGNLAAVIACQIYKSRTVYLGRDTLAGIYSQVSKVDKMATAKNFLGLRGTQLRVAMVLLVVAPSFILFGYNNGSTGGIATLESFVHVSD